MVNNGVKIIKQEKMERAQQVVNNNEIEDDAQWPGCRKNDQKRL